MRRRPTTGFFRRRLALPMTHGAWAWWIGPFLVGLAAAGAVPPDGGLLLLAALASFFLQQPATIAVKAASGRGPRADLLPALAWMAFYGLVAGAAVLLLVLRGHTRFVWLLLPGVPVFAWHLSLVWHRAERRRLLIEVLGAAVLAFWAPAAYWVAGGERYPEPWVLWTLMALQSAGAILTVYLRLGQRAWKEPPTRGLCLRAGRRTLGLHGVALLVALAFVLSDLAPPLVLLAFYVVLLDALDATLRPRPRWMPRRIGFRQLAVTTAFVVAMVAAYLMRGP